MPWKIEKQNGKHCVVKESTGKVVPGGCHSSRADAIKHQRALYAGEASSKEGIVTEMETASNAFTVSSNNGTASFSDVTITISDGTASSETNDAETGETPAMSWEGILGIEGLATGDRRYLMPGEISERDLPLTLMVQTVNAEGHQGSEVGGKIDKIWRISPSEAQDLGFDISSDVPDSAVVIMGSGTFDNSEVGQEAARMVEEQVLRGISIDLAVTKVMPLDPETFQPIDTEKMDLLDMLMGDFITGVQGKIMGATVVPFPAFEEASIRAVTSSYMSSDPDLLTITIGGDIRPLREVLTASAAGLAPLAPPLDWFEMPETDLPCPLTVTEDGQVYGHLAIWGQCHTGYKDICQTPPRSYSEYKFFHLGEIETEEGETVAVGKITVGTGHAPITYNSQKTVEHYDNTGCVAAFVKAKDGRRGIWLSGAIRSDLPAEKIRDLRANPPSGDWRSEQGILELQGILSVPVPGFPVPRSEARLVASGADEETLEALIATGYEGGLGDRARRRRMAVLSARLREVLGVGAFKTYTSDQRKQMAKDGRAMPDGSFPIADCQDAKNARRSLGRTAAGKRPSVERHIMRREKSLGCSNS